MMYGVTIEVGGTSYNTLTQWGLVLLDGIKISASEQKKEVLDIPGANGVLDLSTALTGGEPVFNNREISLTLMAAKRIGSGNFDESYFDGVFREFTGRFHGQICKLIFPFDTSHYFYGRIAVGEKSSAYNIFQISLTMDAEPFRYSTTETTVTKSISTTSSSVSLTNSGQRVIPRFTSTRAATLTFRGTSFSLGANVETAFPGIYLDPGTTSISVRTSSGSGTLTVKYREVTF